MAEQQVGTTENQGNQAEVDPWVAAFAALEQKGEEASEATAPTESTELGGAGSNADAADGSNAAQAEGGNGASDEDAAGGLDTPAGADGGQGEGGIGSAFDFSGVTDESIEQYEKELNENIRNQAINDVAQEFIKRGVRSTNGRLGATMDDPDICKRDEDGVPHFYNPETGQEFRGDNPRSQAQEWVEDYNKELARVFNNACEQYEQHLMESASPRLAVMKFAPKYDKLDDIRKGMFDNVIQDYEIVEDGKVIGYSCDLDKALALVERQIGMIQSYAKQHQAQQQEASSGPALDMKTSSGAVQTGSDKPITSLEEAMLRIQERELEKFKNR